MIFCHTRNASSNSFSLPGGSGSRHSGHTSATPFFRSSATHSVQNACPQGRLVGNYEHVVDVHGFSLTNALGWSGDNRHRRHHDGSEC